MVPLKTKLGNTDNFMNKTGPLALRDYLDNISDKLSVRSNASRKDSDSKLIKMSGMLSDHLKLINQSNSVSREPDQSLKTPKNNDTRGPNQALKQLNRDTDERKNSINGLEESKITNLTKRVNPSHQSRSI